MNAQPQAQAPPHQVTFVTRGSDLTTLGIFMLLMVPCICVPAVGMVVGIGLNSMLFMGVCFVLVFVGSWFTYVRTLRIARGIDEKRSPRIALGATEITIPLRTGPQTFALHALRMESGWYTAGTYLTTLGVRTRATNQGLQLRLRCGAASGFLEATGGVGDGVEAGFIRGFIRTREDSVVSMWTVDLIALFKALQQAGVPHGPHETYAPGKLPATPAHVAPSNQPQAPAKQPSAPITQPQSPARQPAFAGAGPAVSSAPMEQAPLGVFGQGVPDFHGGVREALNQEQAALFIALQRAEVERSQHVAGGWFALGRTPEGPAVFRFRYSQSLAAEALLEPTQLVSYAAAQLEQLSASDPMTGARQTPVFQSLRARAIAAAKAALAMIPYGESAVPAARIKSSVGAHMLKRRPDYFSRARLQGILEKLEAL